MNKEKNTKLLGIIGVGTLILVVFFAVIYLNIKAKNSISNNEENNPPETYLTTTSEYTTPKEKTLYVYHSYSGDETIDDAKFYKNEIVIRKEDDLLQKKTVMSDSSEYDELYEITDLKTTLIGRSDINTREDMVYNYKELPDNNVFVANTDEIVLNTPVVLDTTWQRTDNSVSIITNVNVIIDLPFGNFSAIEVQTNYEDGHFRKDYFVKHLGLVKTVYSNATDVDRTVVLVDVQDKDILSKALLFNYDVYTNEVRIDQIDNSINTNPIYIDILEAMLRYEKGTNSSALIQPETVIQSVKIDRPNDTTYVDFSSKFLKTTNYGVQVEESIISAIVNEIGNFYNTGNVKLSANGSDIVTGHTDLSKPFHVELQ